MIALEIGDKVTIDNVEYVIRAFGTKGTSIIYVKDLNDGEPERKYTRCAFLHDTEYGPLIEQLAEY
jgi:hypothetical protein